MKNSISLSLVLGSPLAPAQRAAPSAHPSTAPQEGAGFSADCAGGGWPHSASAFCAFRAFLWLFLVFDPTIRTVTL